MVETFQYRLSEVLLSHKRHTRHVALVTLAAMIVALSVGLSLRQQGEAKTYEVQVLDCQYNGNGAHTHDASCYDADGVLVCTVKERALHTHDESCYASETYLICGMEEGEGAHWHSDECLDEEGNLVCGLDESEGHVHTDACWQTDTWLACELEEITEEHVHGDGCFKTVVVTEDEDGETTQNPEATDGDAKPNAAADDKATDQLFKGELKAIDENGNEYVKLTVNVKAPADTFANDVNMKIKAVDEQAVADKAQELAAEGETYTVIGAVNISFRDAQDGKVDPAKDVELKITDGAVRDAEDLVLVRIDDDTEVAQKVTDFAKVNADDKDTTVGNEDTAKLTTKDFGTYALIDVLTDEDITSVPEDEAEHVLITTEDDEAEQVDEDQAVTLEATDDENYRVVVECPAEAQVPANATLEVATIDMEGEGYEAFMADVSKTLEADPSFIHLYELRIVAEQEVAELDENGDEISTTTSVEEVIPNAEVKVTIESIEETEVADEDLRAVLFEGDQPLVLEAEEGKTFTYETKALGRVAIVGTDGLAELERLVTRYGAYTIRIAGDADVIPEGAKLVATATDELNDKQFDAFFGLYAETRGNAQISMLETLAKLDLAIVADGQTVALPDGAYLTVTAPVTASAGHDRFVAFVGDGEAVAIELDRAATDEFPGYEVAKLADGSLVLMSAHVADSLQSVSEPSVSL